MTTFRSILTIDDLSGTTRLGRALARQLGQGGAVFLQGSLGAGKTTLVQSVCQALGVNGGVTSPTFDLLHHYQGSAAVILHVDGYRLAEPREWDMLDLPIPLSNNTVLLVEWGEAVMGWYPDRLDLELQRGETSQSRRVRLTARGAAWVERLTRMQEEMREEMPGGL